MKAREWMQCLSFAFLTCSLRGLQGCVAGDRAKVCDYLCTHTQDSDHEKVSRQVQMCYVGKACTKQHL
jgi:hypothetical protein